MKDSTAQRVARLESALWESLRREHRALCNKLSDEALAESAAALSPAGREQLAALLAAPDRHAACQALFMGMTVGELAEAVAEVKARVAADRAAGRKPGSRPYRIGTSLPSPSAASKRRSPV